jgi:hypothetical protein
MALALIRPPFLLFVVFLLDLLLTVFQLEFDGFQLNGLDHGTVSFTTRSAHCLNPIFRQQRGCREAIKEMQLL